MIGRSQEAAAKLPGEHVLQRIAWLTLGFGFAGALIALALQRPDWAEGLIGGAVLGWLNFRWLKRGIRAIVNAALLQPPVAPSEAKPPASDRESAISALGTYFTLLFRYALVALGVYVIFICLHVPLVSIGLGLCSLVAAILASSVWEVLKPAI